MRRKTIKKTLSIVLTAAMISTTYVPVAAEGTVTSVNKDVQSTTSQNETTSEVETPAAEEQTGNESTAQDTESQETTGSEETTEADGTTETTDQETTGSEETKVAKVAEVAGTQYESLQAAVDAAADGATVTLEADATEDVTIAAGKNVVLDLGGKTLTNTNTNKEKATLTVEGKATVKNGSIIGGTSYYNIKVEKNGNLTLADVTATAGNAAASMIDSCGTLTIESGTYTGGLNVVKTEPESNLTINNGSFELKNAVSGYTGVVMNYGTAVIKDGTFTQSATTPIKGTPIVIITAKEKADDPQPHTTILGGKYVNLHSSSNAKIFHGMNKATFADFTVMGGSFSKKVTDYFIPQEYTCDYNGTEYVLVNTVATVGTATDKYPARYTNLATAFTKASGTKTVKLIKNADISQNTRAINVASKKNLTLDLNGHTIKAANTQNGSICVSGKLTLKDSTDVNKNGTGDGAIYTESNYVYGKTDKVLIGVYGGGTFTMESGLIDAVSHISNPLSNGQFAVGFSDPAQSKDAEVVINGGKIRAGWYTIAGNGQTTEADGNITVNGGILESTTDYAIYHPQAGTTTINGGVVSGEAGGVCINRGTLKVTGGTVTSSGLGDTGNWGDGTGGLGNAAIYVNAGYGDTKAMITGGTITANNDAVIVATNNATNKAIIAISGGSFNKEVNADYCATGYAPVKNTDETYGVAAKDSLETSTSVSGSISTATIGGKYSGSEEDSNVTTVGGTVTINVKNNESTKVTASEIIVDKNSLTSLKDNKAVEHVVIKADAGILNIDKIALTKMVENAESSDVILKLEKETKDDTLYYHITASADGKEIYEEGNAGGKVEVTVPYNATFKGVTFSVYYVKDSTTKELVESKYDTENKTLTWSTAHFSTYQVEDNAIASITNGEETTYYSTIQEAIDDATDGQTVALAKDSSIEEVKIESSKVVTLDLNGKTLTTTAAEAIKVYEGTLTIEDTSIAKTGVINATNLKTAQNAIEVSGNEAKFVFNSGRFVSTGSYGVGITQNATVVVNGGTMECYIAPLSGNNTEGNMNVEINGGTLTATAGPAIYMPSQGNLTITGGTLNGGISLRMGNVAISGGTINAATRNLDSPSDYYNYSGNAWLPDALYVFGGTYKSDDGNNGLTLNITGGTFNCTNGQGSAIAIYDLGKEAQESVANISGNAKLNTNAEGRQAYQVLGLSDIGVRAPDTGYGVKVGEVDSEIFGGTFSTVINPEYCKVGFNPKENGDGTYGVEEFSLGTSENTQTKVAATIVEGQDTSEMYAKVGMEGATYTKENYPTTTEQYTYAEGDERGYVFAGWYEKDEDGVLKPCTSIPEDGNAYAKFIDESVLGIRAQITNGTTAGSEKTNMRFITSVDSLNYQKVGFEITIGNKTTVMESNKVYKELYAANGGDVILNNPSSTFKNKESEYFMTCRVNNIPKAHFGTSIKATPYWITKDGTVVKGTGVSKTVSEGIANSQKG